MTPRKVNPPHYFMLALIAMAVLRLVGDDSLVSGAWPWLGVAPIACGIALAVWASQQFARAGTSIVPLTKSTALVTSGAFAVSRNPMYLGMVLVLIGLALLLNRLWPWLVPPLFLGLLYIHFIRHEEKLMRSTFGDAYRSYCQRVRRFI